ncbi:hypothetical protein CRUP_003269 [Coryphaenoides rupestris]|nr:hypothetical protein CRUP_003269 [Coryphaenoides rupestris]
MAAKTGDDPDSLMALTTVFCLRNLRKTMCYQGYRNKLCLRSDIFLPSEICDKLVNTPQWCPEGPDQAAPDLLQQRVGAQPQDAGLLPGDAGLPLPVRLQQHLLPEGGRTVGVRRGHRGGGRRPGNPVSRQALEKDFNFQGFSRLRLLNLGGLPDEVDVEALLKALSTLTSLDLSGVQLARAAFLTQWRDRLASLVLTAIVQRLVHLVSLDISGHVMLDNCTVPHLEDAMGRASIYPFQELKRPLQFLGLYDTTLCNVTHIPAYKVTGSKNEDQVLNAIEAYTEFRPELAHRAINQLFDIARIQHCSQLLRALQLVIAALKCHKYDKSIQVTGSAALFYLTNTDYRSEQSVRLRRQVIQVVLNGMEQYQEVTVQRNCCLTLCNFSIPDDLEFQYSRVNQLLLKILEPPRQEESIQRIAVHLCNALVCQVDNHHKEAVGKMGFTMLNLIQKKLQSRMEFPDKQELHRNMLGLLGNVAEVRALRPQLLTPQFITVFSNLLDSEADGIEVSYNACGVLSHIMFDGPDVWAMVEPLRDTVMTKMWDAIRSWDVTSRRNINYRSFEPILRLLPQGIAPVSQHWATWALFNLISVYREKVMEQCENFKEEPMEVNQGQEAVNGQRA